MHAVRSLLVVAALLLPAVTRANPHVRPADTSPDAGMTIAVADFTGADPKLGRFLAETLLTDLAQSDRLHMVERNEIRQAVSELKLQSTGLFEAQQVKKLGSLVRADRLIVGSYMEHADRFIINARLLDVKTGRLAAGGAGNVSGDRRDLLSLVHSLATQFHRRITGSALSTDGGGDNSPPADPRPPVFRPDPAPDNDHRTAWQTEGILPSSARPNGLVTERDLAALVQRLSSRLPNAAEIRLSVISPTAPVTRLRALTALVKLAVSQDALGEYRFAENGQMQARSLPPDANQVPAWGLAHVAAACDLGWWDSERPLRGRETATWVYVDVLISKLPLTAAGHGGSPARQDRAVLTRDTSGGGFSGLIVDARGLPVERAMSARILDEDGNVVYPDPRSLPSIDYQEDRGMVTYLTSRNEPERIGNRPLVVRGRYASGPGNFDIVVSNSTAARIREANRSSKFIQRWAIGFLVDER